MKKWASLRVIAGVAAALCCASPAMSQARLDSAEFTITLAKGWQSASVPGLKYKVAVTKPSGVFTPNLNIVDEKANVSIEKYADAALKQLGTLPGFKKLDRAAFTTSKGLKGVRLRYQQTTSGHELRQAAYMLPGKGQVKYVVTASALAADGSKFEAAYEAMAKSFALK